MRIYPTNCQGKLHWEVNRRDLPKLVRGESALGEGSGKMKIVDVIIAIPALPALFLLVTWGLPWESWIPWGKLPKIPLGLYILYLSFVSWYFQGPWWMVMIFFVAGSPVLLIGLKKKYGRSGLFRG